MPDESLKDIRKACDEGIADHPTTLDACLFNGTTIVALLFTTLASLLASKTISDLAQAWVAPTLSALAGLLIASDRALDFGSRWRFHIEMKNAYRAIKDMVAFYELLPEKDKPKFLADIWVALRSVRAREANLPNAGPKKKN